MTHHVGEDIRSLRKSREMTLRELAAAVGRSLGWLSQVERGQTTPSVRDLGLIAERLGVTISFFFRSSSRAPEERGLILRAADRMALGSSETGLVEELLSPTLAGAFEMVKSTFAPGASHEGPRRATGGREDGGVLISGRLTLILGGREFTLEPGDSFQFAGADYGWRNDGDTPAVAIWIISPPVY